MGAPDAVPAQGRSAAPIAPLAVTAAVAVVTFLLAYDGGTFGDTSRQTLAVAVWWVVILAGVAGLWPLAGFNRTTLLAGGFLAAYAGPDTGVGHLGGQRGGRLQRVQPRRPLRRGLCARRAGGAAGPDPALDRRLRARDRRRRGTGVLQPLLSRPDRSREPARLPPRSDPTELSPRLLERPGDLRRARGAVPAAAGGLGCAAGGPRPRARPVPGARRRPVSHVVARRAGHRRRRDAGALRARTADADGRGDPDRRRRRGRRHCLRRRSRPARQPPGPDRGGRGARRVSDRSRGLRGDGRSSGSWCSASSPVRSSGGRPESVGSGVRSPPPWSSSSSPRASRPPTRCASSSISRRRRPTR